MKSKALILLIISCMLSCSNNEGKFLITNESDFDIDSLSILPDSNKLNIKIKQGESLKHYINMSEAKTDGNYFISFKNIETSKTISRGFGYYTNGYQTEDIINIKILNDTILINSEFKYLF